MLQFILDHKAFEVTILMLVISEVLPFVKSTQYNGLLQGLLSLLKKVPLVALMFIASSLSACGYCAQVVNKDTARCKAESLAKLCGEPAMMDLINKIGPQVVLALLSGDFGNLLSELITDLTKQGIPDALTAVTCAVQNAGVNLTSPARLPDQAKLVAEHAKAWLGK